jgi:hypothetical protein
MGGHLFNFDVGVESSTVTSIDVSGDDVDDILTETKYMNELFQHIEEENNLECVSEVDHYCLDGCEATTKDFDILLLWKVNAPKYHILAER